MFSFLQKPSRTAHLNSIYILRVTISAVLLVALIHMIPARAVETQAIPLGTNSSFNMQSNGVGGITKVRFSTKIESVVSGSPYFYANQFQMLEVGNVRTGYTGIQERGSRVNGTVGKTAVFSMFDAAIAATPSTSCSVEVGGNFDGYVGRNGTSCRIPYEYKLNVIYDTIIERGAIESDGTWWSGTIIDTSTGISTLIANIKVPPSWKGIGSRTTAFTEYFGGLPATCSQLQYTKVRFYTPRSMADLPGSLISNYYSTTGTCTNSAAYTQENSQVHEIGGNTVKPTVTTKPPLDPTVPAPTNLTVTKKECFVSWCNYKVSWTTTATSPVTHVLNIPGIGTALTTKTSYLVTWVPNGKTYTANLYSADAQGIKSKTTSITFKT